MQGREKSREEGDLLAQRRIVKNAGLIQKCEKGTLGMLAKDRRREGTFKVVADHSASIMRGKQQSEVNNSGLHSQSSNDLRSRSRDMKTPDFLNYKVICIDE